jgi:hypothetical protein
MSLNITLILIAITVVGGVVVYRAFFSTSNIVSNSLHATIEEATLSNSGGLTISIKNDGSIAIASFGTVTVSPTVAGASGCTFAPTSLNPGQTASYTISGPLTATVSDSYQINVPVVGTDSSQCIATFSVVATS